MFASRRDCLPPLGVSCRYMSSCGFWGKTSFSLAKPQVTSNLQSSKWSRTILQTCSGSTALNGNRKPYQNGHPTNNFLSPKLLSAPQRVTSREERLMRDLELKGRQLFARGHFSEALPILEFIWSQNVAPTDLEILSTGYMVGFCYMSKQETLYQAFNHFKDLEDALRDNIKHMEVATKNENGSNKTLAAIIGNQGACAMLMALNYKNHRDEYGFGQMCQIAKKCFKQAHALNSTDDLYIKNLANLDLLRQGMDFGKTNSYDFSLHANFESSLKEALIKNAEANRTTYLQSSVSIEIIVREYLSDQFKRGN